MDVRMSIVVALSVIAVVYAECPDHQIECEDGLCIPNWRYCRSDEAAENTTLVECDDESYVNEEVDAIDDLCANDKCLESEEECSEIQGRKGCIPRTDDIVCAVNMSCDDGFVMCAHGYCATTLEKCNAGLRMFSLNVHKKLEEEYNLFFSGWRMLKEKAHFLGWIFLYITAGGLGLAIIIAIFCFCCSKTENGKRKFQVICCKGTDEDHEKLEEIEDIEAGEKEKIADADGNSIQKENLEVGAAIIADESVPLADAESTDEKDSPTEKDSLYPKLEAKHD